MNCKVCRGAGEVIIPPTMEEPEDCVPCEACGGTGVEPPDAPDGMLWEDYYGHYCEQGVDHDEAVALADRDMVDPREEALVYY